MISTCGVTCTIVVAWMVEAPEVLAAHRNTISIPWTLRLQSAPCERSQRMYSIRGSTITGSRRRSVARTRAPSSRSRAIRWLPIRPVAPATRTFLPRSDISAFLREKTDALADARNLPQIRVPQRRKVARSGILLDVRGAEHAGDGTRDASIGKAVAQRKLRGRLIRCFLQHLRAEPWRLGPQAALLGAPATAVGALGKILVGRVAAGKESEAERRARNDADTRAPGELEQPAVDSPAVDQIEIHLDGAEPEAFDRGFRLFRRACGDAVSPNQTPSLHALEGRNGLLRNRIQRRAVQLIEVAVVGAQALEAAFCRPPPMPPPEG